ncbi:MAG: IS1595 family transposase [Limisphaerales bacterium]
MKINKDNAHLESSDIIEQMPRACSDELAAVEFLEERLWKGQPHCTHCQSANVYAMKGKDGQRNKRFLWRCHDCHGQFTVRIGTVFEESRIPLRHWCYAFWRASTSKKGISAMEIQRQCQLSYKSALFLMHRIRFAMTQNPGDAPKMTGTVEADETYIGGKPRPGTGPHKRGRGTKNTPVLGIVQRDGNIHRRVVANVSAATLKGAIRECVDKRARIITDEHLAYRGLGKEFKGGHYTVNHGTREYARGDVFTNTAESSFALIKRGLMGIYHSVSKKHLPRYLGEFDFRWNTRKLNDGERTVLAIEGAAGKRLAYYGA